jgi:hypothetical protein
MSEPDVVESLKGWRHWHETRNAAVLDEICRRACDEIVALRRYQAEALAKFADESARSFPLVRAEALEDAALVCERMTRTVVAQLGDEQATARINALEDCVRNIRALKNKRDE